MLKKSVVVFLSVCLLSLIISPMFALDAICESLESVSEKETISNKELSSANNEKGILHRGITSAADKVKNVFRTVRNVCTSIIMLPAAIVFINQLEKVISRA